MLFSGILKQKFLYNNIPDPLDKPDDIFNEPQLERHDLVKTSGLDAFHEEEDWQTFKKFKQYFPKWLQWDLNPSKDRRWSVIRSIDDPIDTRDHDTRYLKELEIALHEGHERILIEPQSCANYASTWIRVGEHYHHYAYNWGLASLWISWRHPKAWYLYVPMTFISLCNAYAYSRYWRTDRLHRYALYEPDYDENDIEMLMLKRGTCPSNFMMLKRTGRVRSIMWYVLNQSAAVFSAILTSVRMGQIEEWVVGPTYRNINVDNPINTCEYFMPAFIDWERAWPPIIPSDIPNLNITDKVGATLDGWFFLCLFGYYVWDRFQKLKTNPEQPEVFLDSGGSPEHNGSVDNVEEE